MDILYPIVFLWTLHVAHTEDIQKEGGVLVLTENNFESAIKSHDYILVEFYAPWCGHCQALAPELEKAAKELEDKGSVAKLAKVDATKEEKLGAKYEVDGYPTLKFFKKGTPQEFNGPREAEGIVNWLNKKLGPSTTEIKEVGKLREILEDEEALVVGFFEDLNGGKANIFKEVADSYDDIKFFLVSESGVMKEFYQKDGSIMVLKTFDEKETHFTDKLSKENLLKFVQTSSRPLIHEFTQENAEKIFSSDIVKHFLLLSNKSDTEYKSRIETLKLVAKEYRDKIIFVHLDIMDEEAESVLEFFGVKPEKCPTFVIFEIESSSKYLPLDTDANDITASNMGGFIKEYLDGKVQKHLKSAELPADWNEKPVKVLVSTNFKEVAEDETKDVFVKFYAPWCGHCKAIAPIWDELAEKFKENQDIVFAKVDAVENEIDEIEVEGFPTFKLFKKQSNEVVDYNGKRDLESMVKFLETGEQEEEEEEEEDEDEEAEDYPDEDEDEEGEDKDDLDFDEADDDDVIEESLTKSKDEL